MHEILSSILSVLLSPFNWLVILILLALYSRKKKLKKKLLILAAILFIIFGNNALLNLYIDWYQPKPISLPSLSQYSCGIVLGGFASPGANNAGYFNATSDRFIQAVKLYRKGKISHLLISGGNGKTEINGFHEAGWVKTQLMDFGVPDSVIIVEDQSSNTIENAFNSRKILDSAKLQPPYLLITSAFHMPRAIAIFNNSGISVDPFPCNFTGDYSSFSFMDLLPRPSVLLDWERYLKETLGYYWNSF